MDRTGEWRGFQRDDFIFDGHEVIVVRPDTPAPGRPWVWRAEFFDAFPQVDEAMVREGYHLACVRLSDRYGCPSAVEDMEAFRAMLVARYDLGDRPHIFGFSRGALYAVNYALKYPAHTGCLYLDAPVMDVRSWPGGKGKGCGSAECWQGCLACYGLTEETAASFRGNPLDRAGELAALKIPVALVAGGSDATVPFDENGWPFGMRFEQAGGELLMIVKPTCDHHPHSLADPDPVVRFLIKHDVARRAAEG